MYEGPCKLNWPFIIDLVVAMGVKEFYEDGGWKRVLSIDDSDDSDDQDESAADESPQRKRARK